MREHTSVSRMPHRGSRWCTAVVAAALGALTLAQPAFAERAVLLGETMAFPLSDGRQLLFDGGPGLIRTIDPVARRAGTIRLGEGCRMQTAGTRTVAVGCRPANTFYALDTLTGARTALPGGVGEIGLNWANFVPPVPAGERPGSQTYLNWRTGEQRLFDIYDDTPVDLDRVPFRRVVLHLRDHALDAGVARGPVSLVTRSRINDITGGEAVLVRRDTPGARLLGRCSFLCVRPVLSTHQAAWIDESLGNARLTVVRAIDLRDGRRRAWRVRLRTHDPTRLLAVGDTIILNTTESGSLNAPFRIYRLDG